MKTVNLKKESPSVGELLALARKKSVLLLTPDGASFVLEEADDFDREVAELGGSVRFMRFLGRRINERGATSIEQFADELAKKAHRMPGQRKRRVAAKSPRATSARGKHSRRHS
jgi:hypothetical protein